MVTVPRVIVATTAMLTFISFRRAATIVLNDLASSAYYAGGESESFIGKSAPWFMLGVMLFSYCAVWAPKALPLKNTGFPAIDSDILVPAAFFFVLVSFCVAFFEGQI